MIPVRVLHWLGQRSRTANAKEFLRAVGDPGAAQRARLRLILRRNAGTSYGQTQGFGSITTPEEYAQRVPIVTPLEHQAQVNRMLAGEANVLTAEAPVYYVQTTGSTGDPKHVPVTPSYRVEFQKALHASLWHLYRAHPEACRGRVLYFVGSANAGVAADGCPIGTMSGYNFTAMPSVVRAMYAWPQVLFGLRDLRTRNFLALQLALQAAPTLCATIFPLGLVLLFRELERRADELAHHLERGTLPDDLVLSNEERALFRSLVKKRPDRAAGLRAGIKGDLVPNAFPELAAAVCWTSATAKLYVPELQRWLGGRAIVRDAVYSAAEGWMNVPLGGAEPGGPVCVTGHYLEFIPEAELESASPTTLGAHQVEVGQRYGVLLTTSGGSYRYSLGDVIEVYDTFHATPCIRFVRKAGAHCSLVGEKLDEAHVNLAVAGALEDLSCESLWFCLAPRTGGEVPGYTLHIEAAPKDAASFAADLAQRVDRGLRGAARDYAAHREDASLAPVEVAIVEPGTFEAWRAAQAAEGAAVAQQKACHLVSDTDKLPAPMRPAEPA
ncbi:MAG: GH3 auxin-responsive promoter family protein [Planctomycetes bacterium]|nr:GH3 auxin-responsive promoter family protein [Planctomycetota bacterium]